MSPFLKLVLLATAFSFTAFFAHDSWAVGFSSGNEFTTQWLSGSVTMYCHNQSFPGGGGFPTTQDIACHRQHFYPETQAYFLGPAGVRADRVLLQVTRADGSRIQKDSGYESSAGKSKEAFNLAIPSSVDRPLLNVGANQVHWVLTVGGHSVSEGDFTATVNSKADASCPHGSYDTPYGLGCENTSYVCDTYFGEFNYCQ